jgi:hypothetical protein
LHFIEFGHIVVQSDGVMRTGARLERLSRDGQGSCHEPERGREGQGATGQGKEEPPRYALVFREYAIGR